MSRFEKEPADSDPEGFDCFVCGRPMTTTLGMKTRRCSHCDVTELRHTEPYIPLVRTVRSLTTSDGEIIPFVDHSVEHLSSPA